MQDRAPVTLGLRLQEARKLADISARELDRLAETTEGHASLIEAGTVTNVKLNTLTQLARVLGVSMSWLIDGAGDAPTVESVGGAVEAARAVRAEKSGEHAAVDASKTRAG